MNKGAVWRSKEIADVLKEWREDMDCPMEDWSQEAWQAIEECISGIYFEDWEDLLSWDYIIEKDKKEIYGQEEETTQETCQEDADKENTDQPKGHKNPGYYYSKAYAHITEGSS